MADAEALVNALRAAGETTRLRLLALLAHGEQSVKDLTEVLGQSQPRVSRHLKLLADAGMIVRHAEGAWAYYALAPGGAGADLAQWLMSRLDPDDPELADDYQRLKQIRAAQQAQAAAYFSKVAASWDELRRLHVPESAVEQAIVAAMRGQKVDLLIDLGTGTGRMLELLAPYYRRGVGIDQSREMLGVARAKLAASNVDSAAVRLGDIDRLDAALGPADVVVLHQVLHYFDDPGRVITAAKQLLKPGGRLLIVDFAAHDLEFLRTEHAHRRLGLADDQLAGWAQSVGLAIGRRQAFTGSAGQGPLTVCLWILEDATMAMETTT